MSRTIEEIQDDIRTLRRVPSLFIDQKLKELADEVGDLCEQSRTDAIDEFATTLCEGGGIIMTTDGYNRKSIRIIAERLKKRK